MTELYTVTDDKIQLNLHQGQTEIWDAEQRFLFMIAGTQGGKTSFGPWWLFREIYGGWGLPGCGSGDYFAATSSFDLFKLKMLPELLNIFEHVLGVARYYAGDMVMELKDPVTGEFHADRSTDPMWGRIILRSATAKGGLESATAQAAWLDEVGQDEFPLSAWEAVIRRLSLSQGRVLGTTTLYNLGWLKRQIVDRKEQADIKVVQFASTMNPNFPLEEYERARKTMPGWKFRMFYEGVYARPAGMIYGDFIDQQRERGGHIVELLQFPPSFPHYIGVDPGAVNTATVWLAQDTVAGVYYVYRSTLEGGMSTREHVERARTYAVQHGHNIVVWGVGAKSEVQQRLDWRDEGVPATEPPFHDVESGIDRVISLLRQHRLFFVEDNGDNGMNGLFDELATYSRELDDEGQSTDKIKDKQKYHRLDALRYVIASTSLAYEQAGEVYQGERYRFSGSDY